MPVTIPRALTCFAHGHNGAWEAICVDFDIAVAGRSFEEVRQTLERAIVTYVEDATKEDEATRAALLARRAPWLVRLRHGAAFLFAALGGRSRSQDAQIPFSVPCHV